MKTIAIVGVGPGLGLSVARHFGRQGFRVAIITRTQTRLDTYIEQLKSDSIEVAGFQADVMETAQLETAFAQIKETFGEIDVLDYNLGPSDMAEMASVLDLTHKKIQVQLQKHIHGPLTSVQAVLPDMLTRGNGTLFFTTGLSSVKPMPILANIGIAMAGLRNYAHNLHEVLADKGIYVGHLVIATGLQPRLPGEDPAIPAALLYDMYEKRDRVEEIFHGRQ